MCCRFRSLTKNWNWNWSCYRALLSPSFFFVCTKSESMMRAGAGKTFPIETRRWRCFDEKFMSKSWRGAASGIEKNGFSQKKLWPKINWVEMDVEEIAVASLSSWWSQLNQRPTRWKLNRIINFNFSNSHQFKCENRAQLNVTLRLECSLIVRCSTIKYRYQLSESVDVWRERLQLCRSDRWPHCIEVQCCQLHLNWLS